MCSKKTGIVRKM